LWRGWLKNFQNNSQGGGGLAAVGRDALCLDWFTLLWRGDYDYDYDNDIVIVIVIVIPVGMTIVIVNVMVIVIAIVLVTVINIVIATHTQGQTDPSKQYSHPVGNCFKKL
jgi:hypothetical protein